MRVAIIGSRDLPDFDLTPYLPENITEIVSGGARGIDTVAKNYALRHNIKYTEIRPEYSKYGRIAPLLRNLDIIDNSDVVYAFWDGTSNGTRFVIAGCHIIGVPVHVFVPENSILHFNK